MGENQNYPGKGKLGQAIIDFRKHYCLGATQEWSLYWKEFADQAFTDLIAIEVENADLKSKLEKANLILEKVPTHYLGTYGYIEYPYAEQLETYRKIK